MTFLVNLHMQRRRAPRRYAPLPTTFLRLAGCEADVTMRTLLAAHPSSAIRAALFTSRATASPSTTSTGRSLKPAAPHLLDCRIQARQGLHLTAPPARSPPTLAHPCCPAIRSAESPCSTRGASGARMALAQRPPALTSHAAPLHPALSRSAATPGSRTPANSTRRRLVPG